MIRVIHTLWAKKVQKGCNSVERHDGSAATCDDFVQAMEDASDVESLHFRRWYSQSGTPIVTVKDDYNPEPACTLTISQRTPSHADQAENSRCIFHLPSNCLTTKAK
ncbi:hypothetical protein ACLK19_06500 [Escherichia coli]